MLNTEVEEIVGAREEKRVINLRSTSAQESINFVRETRGRYINSEELTTI